MSLRIIINNQEARLPEDCQIELKLTNAFFNEREEDATYPLSLNITANRHIFTFSDRFDSDDFTSKHPAKVYFGPYCLLDGHCIVTDISGSEIEVFITTKNSTFWSNGKTEYLDDLNLGSETYSSVDAMMEAFTSSTFGGMDYVVVPLYDPFMDNEFPGTDYIDFTRPFYNPMLPYSGNDNTETPVSIYTCGGSGLHRSQHIYTPFIRLFKLIQKLFFAKGYQIVRNDLDSDNYFKDIIVVYRGNGRSYATGNPSFEYAKRVPHILVSDFLYELENKFGVQFVFNESSKTVSIISHGDTGVDIAVEASDLLQKHAIDEDDQKQHFIFKDKDNPDKLLVKYYDDHKLISSPETPDDAKIIECTSNIVAWTYPETYTRYRTNHMAVSATDGNKDEYLEAIKSEFRLSVYRGFIKCNELPDNTYVPYPIASAEPLDSPDQTNNMSLLWDARSTTYQKTLFNQYHSSRIDYISDINREYQFILKHSVNDLINFHNYFLSDLIIRNQRYRCYEINIKLSNTKIIEHIVKCYPA